MLGHIIKYMDTLREVKEVVGEEKSERIIAEFGEKEFFALTMASSLEVLKDAQKALNDSIEETEERIEILLEEIE